MVRQDLGDVDKILFTDEILARCLKKAAFYVSRDTSNAISVGDTDTTPDPDPGTCDLLILKTKVNACQVMRATTANAFSFSSGEQRVDKTAQPKQWESLEERFQTEYEKLLAILHPDKTESSEAQDFFVTAPFVAPGIYSPGVVTLDEDDLNLQ